MYQEEARSREEIEKDRIQSEHDYLCYLIECETDELHEQLLIYKTYGEDYKENMKDKALKEYEKFRKKFVDIRNNFWKHSRKENVSIEELLNIKNNDEIKLKKIKKKFIKSYDEL